jgi:hypothetical protein
MQQKPAAYIRVIYFLSVGAFLYFLWIYYLLINLENIGIVQIEIYSLQKKREEEALRGTFFLNVGTHLISFAKLI